MKQNVLVMYTYLSVCTYLATFIALPSSGAFDKVSRISVLVCVDILHKDYKFHLSLFLTRSQKEDDRKIQIMRRSKITWLTCMTTFVNRKLREKRARNINKRSGLGTSNGYMNRAGG